MRKVLTINAKNKREALAAIDIMKDRIKKEYPEGEINMNVSVANEGTLPNERAFVDNITIKVKGENK